MNKVVVDTNIIFSAMLNINSRIAQILINGNQYYHFYSPEYVRFEIFKYKERIKGIAKLSDNDFIEIYELVMRNITVVNHSIVPIENYKKAIDLCKTIDENDTVFVALVEYFQGILWTGDLKLINGLLDKKYSRIIRTEELYREFISKEYD